MAAKRQRLEARRKVVGLSQEQRAERLVVERSTVVRHTVKELDDLREAYGLRRSDAW